MKLEIEITQPNGEKLPSMVIENISSKEVLPVVKNIMDGVCKNVVEDDK